MVIPFYREECQERLPGIPEPFDPIPWEVREIDGALAMFMEEILVAKSLDRCLEIRRILADVALRVMALESSALDRATRIHRESA